MTYKLLQSKCNFYNIYDNRTGTIGYYSFNTVSDYHRNRNFIWWFERISKSFSLKTLEESIILAEFEDSREMDNFIDTKLNLLIELER